MVRIEKFCYMIEIGDTAMNIVRNCMLRERLWSESHFRLVSRHSCFKKDLINSNIRLDTNQSFIIVVNTDAVVAQLTLLLFVVTVVLSTFKFKIQGQ